MGRQYDPAWGIPEHGRFVFEFDTPETCTNYRRELSLDDAIGRVSYTIDGVDYLREYFASNPDSVIVVRLTTPGHKGKLNFSLRMQDGRQGMTRVDGHTMTIKGTLDLLSYEAQALLQADGGMVETKSDRLEVKGADAVTVVLTGATNFDLASPTYTRGDADEIHRRVSARMDKAARKSYKEVESSASGGLPTSFARVELDLDAEQPDYTTDVLVREHKDNAYLDMLYFQYGRYLMLGSSRGGQLPSNLQGLWNNVNNPAWECDYHSNINVQMNYWPAEVANLSECLCPVHHLRVYRSFEGRRLVATSGTERELPRMGRTHAEQYLRLYGLVDQPSGQCLVLHSPVATLCLYFR